MATQIKKDDKQKRKMGGRHKSGDYERTLAGIVFPKVDHQTIQDDLWIAVATRATNVVRKIDNVRKEFPRFFEPSKFQTFPATSTTLSPSAQAKAEALGEDFDHDAEFTERDDEESFDLEGNRIGQDEPVGESEDSEFDGEIDGETLIHTQEEEEALANREAHIIPMSEVGEGMGKDRYINKDKQTLPKHLDPRYVTRDLAGHNKTQEEVEESLKDWYDEYKFIAEGGHFSLAEQTRRHQQFIQDYDMRVEAEKDGELDTPYEIRSNFLINEVLQIGRHCKVTKGGRIYSYSALVLVGTGKGTAGFGYGKGTTAPEATGRAFVDAERNLISIPLYRGGLPGGFSVRKRGSFVKVWTISPGPNRNANESSMVPHPIMNNIIQAFGFNNANIRTWKRRNWHNMLEGIFSILPKVASHPEDTARRMGLKLKVLAHEERFDRLKPHYM